MKSASRESLQALDTTVCCQTLEKHFKELVPCHTLCQTLGMHSFLSQISVTYPHFIDEATEAVTLTYLLPKVSEPTLGAMTPSQTTGRETIRLPFHPVSIYGHFPPTHCPCALKAPWICQGVPDVAFSNLPLQCKARKVNLDLGPEGEPEAPKGCWLPALHSASLAKHPLP